MSSLNSSSTNAQVWAAYDDNASFEEDSSPAKAAAFITACIVLLRRRPNQVSTDSQSVAFDAVQISNELKRARKWLAANRSGSGSAIFQDFGGVRD